MRHRALAASLLAVVVVLALVGSAYASASGVVISEFRFRGPTGGNDEFVELFNTSSSPVDISGWRLQGCTSTTGAPIDRTTVPAGTVLAAGQHYLFTNSSGYSGTVAGDRTYSTGISDNAGVRILNARDLPEDAVGSVGPSAQCREGSGLTIPTTNGDNAFERRDGGRQDTNDNVADFVGPKASNPQNSGSTPEPPPAPLVQIAQIQGAGHLSALTGVVRTEGVVIAERGSSTWIQDTTPDLDPETSEALLVFGSTVSSVVAVGDLVQVRGTVTEFRAGFNNLTVTQLASPNLGVTKLGTAPLPAATVIGAGGRVPPIEVIENDSSATGNVETSNTFDPAQDGVDFYETLESMLVQVNNPVAVGPRNQFGEILVLANNGAGASVRTTRGGIVVRDVDPATVGDYQNGDFNPERIMLDDLIVGSAGIPNVDVADGFTTSAVGVMTYDFANYKIAVTSALTAVDGGLARETTGAPLDQEIAVATFNVENLSPASPPEKFAELAGIIVNNLRAPDIISVEEVQDNSGPTDNGVTDASQTWTMLVAAIQAAGGPTYQYRQIDPVNNQDGGVPGANIRVGFLFRTDRGVEFVDRPGAGPTTANEVLTAPNGSPQLRYSPGRIDPTNPAWSSPEGVRKPLAAEFKARGKRLFVIANHWKSKNGDQPLFGRFQPPVRGTEPQRNAEATVVRDFVRKILTIDQNANVIVLGDLNDFEFSEALTILEDDGRMNTLIEELPQSERYSYVFEGNSQTLDHIVVSDNLRTHFRFEYDSVHVNAEFVDQASDHDPQVARFDLHGPRAAK